MTGPTSGSRSISKKREAATRHPHRLATSRFADPKMAWSDLVKGRLVVHRVLGGHLDMFQDEGADRTAEHLQSLSTKWMRSATKWSGVKPRELNQYAPLMPRASANF